MLRELHWASVGQSGEAGVDLQEGFVRAWAWSGVRMEDVMKRVERRVCVSGEGIVIEIRDAVEN